MRLTIAVDANPILAALLGGYARAILFDPRFSFITTEFTIIEVQRYLPMVAEKSGVPMEALQEALDLIPIEIFVHPIYQSSLHESKRRMAHIDPDDIEILALALHFSIPLWTNDLHFTKLDPPINLLRTRDFIL